MKVVDKIASLIRDVKDPLVAAEAILLMVRETLRGEFAAGARQERDREAARIRKRRQRELDEAVTLAVTSRDQSVTATVTKRDAVSPPLDPLSSESLFPEASLTLKADPERAIYIGPPSLLTFECDGKEREFHVLEAMRREHEEAFPALDVMAEYRKALGWIRAAPSRRKTARGMPRFLFSWLSRAQDYRRDTGVTNGHQPARNFREEAIADAFARSRPARSGGEP